MIASTLSRLFASLLLVAAAAAAADLPELHASLEAGLEAAA